MTKNLDQLRQVAERATPGPWAVYDRGIGYEVHDASGYELNGGMRETFTEADATHIATFDPPTVLALIDRAAAAEREAVAAKSVIAQHIVTQSFETSRTVGIAVDEAVRVVAKMLEADTDRRARDAEARAEAAEQAVDFHTQRDHELKTLLSMIADRLDEFSYDELSSLIEDEPLNQWSEKYTSKLQAAEAAVQRVRELAEKWISRVQGPVQWVQLLEMHYELTRTLDGGEQK